MTSLHSTTKVPDSEDGYCMDCGETFRYVGPDHVCYKTLRKLEVDSERLDWLDEWTETGIPLLIGDAVARRCIARISYAMEDTA